MVKFQGVPNYNYFGTTLIEQKYIYIKKNLLVDSWMDAMLRKIDLHIFKDYIVR